MAYSNDTIYVWGGSVDDTRLYSLGLGSSAWVAVDTTGTPPQPRKYFPYFLYGDYFYVLPGSTYMFSDFSVGCYRISFADLVWENLDCELDQVAFAYTLHDNAIFLLGGVSSVEGITNRMLVSEIADGFEFAEISPHWDYPKPRLGHSLHTSGESLWLFGGYSQGV